VAQEWVSGLLFEPKNEHALAVALRSLIDDPPLREKLSQALLERSRKEFSLEAMVGHTIGLYRSAS
jgi:glycosyltransferase involved in cell wall biosynthesis